MDQPNTEPRGGGVTAPTAEDAAASFDAALVYARKRNYREASECLADAVAGGGCTEAEALDLQARMYVQQGRALEAERSWIRAQALDPGNPLFAAGLGRLRRGPRSFRPAVTPAIVVLAVVAAGGFALQTLSAQRQMAALALETRQIGERLAAQDEQISALTRMATASAAEVTAGLERQQQAIQVLSATLVGVRQAEEALGTKTADLLVRVHDDDDRLDAMERSLRQLQSGIDTIRAAVEHPETPPPAVAAAPAVPEEAQ